MIYFYCQDEFTVHGPADRDDLERLLRSGRLTGDTTFCAEGSSDWLGVNEVFPGLSLPEMSHEARKLAAPRGPFFYCIDGTNVEGPFKPDDLVPLLRTGTLPADTLVCTAEDETWRPVSSVFSYLLETMTPRSMETVRNLIAAGPSARIARLESGGYHSSLGSLGNGSSNGHLRPGFREVRCTSCDNEALLPETMESAFCMFCGTKIDASSALSSRPRLPAPRPSIGLLEGGNRMRRDDVEELGLARLASRNRETLRLPGPPTELNIADGTAPEVVPQKPAAPGLRMEGRNIQLTLPSWDDVITATRTGNPVFSKTAQVLYLVAAFGLAAKGIMMVLPEGPKEPQITANDMRKEIKVEVRPEDQSMTPEIANAAPMQVVEIGAEPASAPAPAPAVSASATPQTAASVPIANASADTVPPSAPAGPIAPVADPALAGAAGTQGVIPVAQPVPMDSASQDTMGAVPVPKASELAAPGIADPTVTSANTAAATPAPAPGSASPTNAASTDPVQIPLTPAAPASTAPVAGPVFNTSTNTVQTPAAVPAPAPAPGTSAAAATSPAPVETAINHANLTPGESAPPSDPLNRLARGMMNDLLNGNTGAAQPASPAPAASGVQAPGNVSGGNSANLASMTPQNGVNPSTLLVQPPGVPLPKTESERIQYGARALNIDLEKAAYVATEDAIEDPTGSLNSFLDSLTRTQQGKEGAVTRILHYGDSIVVMDYITGQMRERMRTLFGDSGTGYMLLHRPSASYQRLDVGWKSGGGWKIDSIMEVKPKPGDYSLGGFAFDGEPGAFAEYSLKKKHDGAADPYSLIEVHYMARPGGGKFDIQVDGKNVATVDTKADDAQARVSRLRVREGAETVRISVAHGSPRLLGVVLERTRPGIVYDAAGILGARCLRLKEIRPDLLIAQLKERHPDLIVLNFGANESDDAGRSQAAIEADYSRLLALFRQALPKTSILVMGALDRGDKTGGKTVTKKNIPTIIMAQRAAALKNGCAFFNTFLAMGGDGTMARWNAMRPRLVSGDLIHPTEPGAAIVGDALYRAVMKSFLLRVAEKALTPAPHNAPVPGVTPPSGPTTPTPLNPPATTPNPTASHTAPGTTGEPRKPAPPTAANTVPASAAPAASTPSASTQTPAMIPVAPIASAVITTPTLTPLTAAPAVVTRRTEPTRTTAERSDRNDRDRADRSETRSESRNVTRSADSTPAPTRRPAAPNASNTHPSAAPISRPASRPVSATPASIYE
ncbi:MAG: GYF domain-containing protein [Candidatus Methylacidiphilales bacterium]|nr:GYF domain-containing protein [Candidatus Methylacidiphilales bacterium]